tara:strand:+ start:121 stop:495 length:375 start_codon:yes stop_codon:yes gene_type:complete
VALLFTKDVSERVVWSRPRAMCFEGALRTHLASLPPRKSTANRIEHVAAFSGSLKRGHGALNLPMGVAAALWIHQLLQPRQQEQLERPSEARAGEALIFGVAGRLQDELLSAPPLEKIKGKWRF